MKLKAEKLKMVTYGVISLILLSAPGVLGPYGTNLLSEILIFGIFAMGLDLLMGSTGMVSLGHATFFGVGAYTAGILLTQGISSFFLILIIGVLASVMIAIPFGALVIRMSGPYFLLLTLALGQLVHSIAWQWRSLTGGDDGLPGIPRPEIGLPWSLWSAEAFFYFILVLFALSAFTIRIINHSAFGRALRGIRESESRMNALGYNTWLYKYVAFVLSGSFAGFAGILFAYHNGFVSPNDLSWVTSGYVVLMVIIGGSGTLYGPCVGAAIFLLLQYVVSSYTEYWSLVMGAVFIFCVMYLRRGIWGYLIHLRKRQKPKIPAS
ncbi:MAG: branched-chain amino acid ABC transporter permease [Desulfobacteraceae bacterium]|nr:MAG: branched-chain amino acid ABC transporter permease [Desulfobacteraceae bacterium]